VLGCTAEEPVSEDHFSVARQVTPDKGNKQALVPMVDEVERQSEERSQPILPGSGFFCHQNLQPMEARGMKACLIQTQRAS
jgi:hypothetical protein